MPAKKKQEKPDKDEETPETPETLESPKVTKVIREGDGGTTGTITISVLPTKKRVSFDTWASVANIPERHRAGMRAFVAHPETTRTLDAWYLAFSEY